MHLNKSSDVNNANESNHHCLSGETRLRHSVDVPYVRRCVLKQKNKIGHFKYSSSWFNISDTLTHY